MAISANLSSKVRPDFYINFDLDYQNYNLKVFLLEEIDNDIQYRKTLSTSRDLFSENTLKILQNVNEMYINSIDISIFRLSFPGKR